MDDIIFGRKFRRPYQVYAELITEARKAALNRGHHMSNARLIRHYNGKNECYKMTGQASCKKCGMLYSVTTKPDPNDTWVTGNAVALNCEGK